MIDTSKKFYISGPVSGRDPEEVRLAFQAAADTLRKEGVKIVVDPYNTIGRLGDQPGVTDPFTHGEYMRLCIAALKLCGAVLLLPGWRKSTGACMEVGAAIAYGLKLYEVLPTGILQELII